MLDRRIRLARVRIVEDQVSVGKGAALGVLPREANGNPVFEQGGVRECLTLTPVDPALVDPPAPTIELLRELGVDREPVRHGEQLLVEGAQPICGDSRDHRIPRRRLGRGLDDGRGWHARGDGVLELLVRPTENRGHVRDVRVCLRSVTTPSFTSRAA